MNTFKLIVAGSRSFCNYAVVKDKVDHLLSNRVLNHQIEIVSGGAQGPDTLGRAYAIEQGYRVSLMLADWEVEGKSAGMRRNERMADYADAAVVFWDGKSVGSKHMIDEMKRRNKPVRVVRVDVVRQEMVQEAAHA